MSPERAERPTGNGDGRAAHDARAATRRPRIADRLALAWGGELEELYRFWAGAQPPAMPRAAGDLRAALTQWMSDPATVEARVLSLGRRLAHVLGVHVDSPSYRCGVEDLEADRALAHVSRYELEASLGVLVRHGFLVDESDGRAGARTTSIPVEIGDAIVRQRRARRRGIFDVLTLRGFLDRQYDDPARSHRISPTRLRELYKMYASDSAAVARVERLQPELRALVEKAVVQFGGLLPRALFDRMEAEHGSWNAARWKGDLEGALVGTVERLDLARYGIHHGDEALLVFNEVAVAWLKRVAVPGDPDQPHSEATLGVDLVSNISRFIGFILENDVRFTVRGEIFKTTEKRILQELIPNPGRELTRAAVLEFIFGFARQNGLIERTGERTFAMTGAGRQWEQRALEQKLEALLDHAVEEQGVAGDFFHQVRLRRIHLRLLKRVEPLTWYDLMYLPFLARNTYLASLDQLAIDEYFAARARGGKCAPMEDPQRLAWNLARWVRQRLHLLGIVDLGYDRAGRPVAMRLTRVGARLLGVVDGVAPSARLLGSLIVTPDFEVVLFPTGDDAELVHELDRFCVREKHGETLHFRIVDRSVQRALSEGMLHGRIVELLRSHSRTPVPQNVLYSVRDWAQRAGLMTLGSELVLRCEDPDTLRRFQQDPGVKALVREPLDERRLQLKARYAPRRTAALLREFGYLVELET